VILRPLHLLHTNNSNNWWAISSKWLTNKSSKTEVHA
jgi:hypothetical protein